MPAPSIAEARPMPANIPPSRPSSLRLSLRCRTESAVVPTTALRIGLRGNYWTIRSMADPTRSGRPVDTPGMSIETRRRVFAKFKAPAASAN